MGREPTNVRVVPSDTEPTLVADIGRPLSPSDADILSERLGQESIAQHFGGGQGMLAGRLARKWGPFSGQYFRTQGGDRLANEMAGRTPIADLNAAFARGASPEDLGTMATGLGLDIDPAALAVHTRMRDAGSTPAGLGAFVDAPYGYEPEALAQYRTAEKQMQERQIAQSKGLEDVLAALPSDEDLSSRMASARMFPIGEAPAEPQGVSARGVHISRIPDLQSTDPAFFGTGHRGAEYKTTKNVLPDRTYFYTGQPGEVAPERSVLGMAGDRMASGPRYAYEAPLSNMYPLGDDPEKLLAMLQAYHLPAYEPKLPYYAHMGTGIEGTSPIPDMENLIKAKGYAGYIAPGNGRAAVYGPVKGLTPLAEGQNLQDIYNGVDLPRFAVGGAVKGDCGCGGLAVKGS